MLPNSHSTLHIDDTKIACGHLIMKLLEFLPKYKAIELLSMFYWQSWLNSQLIYCHVFVTNPSIIECIIILMFLINNSNNFKISPRSNCWLLCCCVVPIYLPVIEWNSMERDDNLETNILQVKGKKLNMIAKNREIPFFFI